MDGHRAHLAPGSASEAYPAYWGTRGPFLQTVYSGNRRLGGLKLLWTISRWLPSKSARFAA